MIFLDFIEKTISILINLTKLVNAVIKLSKKKSKKDSSVSLATSDESVKDDVKASS